MLQFSRNILIIIYSIHFLSTATSLVTQNAEVSGAVTNRTAQISDRKVWVTYNSSSFKQISVQNDTTELQVIAPFDQRLSLDCHHNWEIEPFDYVKFEYIGVNKNYAKPDPKDFGNVTIIYSFNLQKRSPVVRIVCKSHKDDIKKSTLIYGGDGIEPFLYKSDSLKPYMLNRTHIALPCILNYPLRNHSHFKLELYKDKKLLQIENSAIQYIPEVGYVTDFEKLGTFGKYECKVANSTEDDQVTLDFNQSSLIYLSSSDLAEKTVPERQKQTFKCSLPRSKFQDGIEWFYKFENGSFSQINFNSKPNPNTTEKYYQEIVSVSLVSADIKHVVCAANGTRDVTDISSPSVFNTSFPVYVSRVIKPNIPDIVYNSTAKTLQCNVSGTEIEGWRWLKDGKNLTEPDPHIEKHHRRSTIYLNQVPKPHNGTYTCIASNFRGESSANYTVHADIEILPGKWSYIVVATSITFAIFLALGISVIVVYKVSFERRDLFLPRFWEKRLNPDQGPRELRRLNEFYDEDREIDPSHILPSDRVRSGNFGQVTLTQLRLPDGSLLPIAVKCIQNASIFRMRTRQIAEQELFDILAEIELGQKLGQHPNIVRYIGAITTGLRNYSASIILEYCCGGDLHTFVGRHRLTIRDDIHEHHVGNGSVLKCSHLLKWAEEIAAGVEYLHSRDIIHRDIAARNVLLWHQNNTLNEEDVIPSYELVAKIADFGMSKDLSSSGSLYYQPVQNDEDPERRRLRSQIPCRWIACETLRTLKFTKQSDVWALGVTWWEMFALSQTPYIEIFPNNDNLRENLFEFLFDGTNNLEMPEFVHPTVWENIILPCWNRFPGSRPLAGGLREGLHQINLDVMAMFRTRAEQEDGLIAQDQNHVDNGINQQLPLPLPGYVQVQHVQDE